MQRLLLTLLMSTLFTTPAFAKAQATPLVIEPNSLTWTTGTDLPEGAKVAILAGDPTKKQAFVARIMLPANAKIAAHSHPGIEYDTVLSGSLYLGVGSKSDPQQETALPTGSFVMIPAKLEHYSYTKEDTIVQVNGMGPWGMVYSKERKDS